MTSLSLPGRLVLFFAATLAVWAAYFCWRPPGPMLYLKHVENLGRHSEAVSITIDDGPHPLTTPLLLAALKRANVPATFFVVGEGLRFYPELAHRIVAEGHELANHSHPHHNLTTVAAKDFPEHIDRGFEAIARVNVAAGKAPGNLLFRPPGGGLNRAAMEYLYRRGFTLAWWSNNPGDWTCPPPWKIARSVNAHLRPGDILLLHDGGTGTPQAIPAIVKEARRRGLDFEVMPDERR